MPTIDTGATTLFYDVTGPEDAPVVLFSNSLGTTLEMWDEVVRRLGGRYRCIRYDTRGHGRSPAVPGDADIDTLADDVARLMDALALPAVHFVGLSLGGMTGQALASRHPQRVLTLTLMATASQMQPGSAWIERAALVEAEGTAAIVEATMGRWFTPGFREAQPSAVEKVRRHFLACDAKGYAACCRIIAGMDLTGRLGAITAPTLVVAGAQDPATPPSAAEAIASRVPGAVLEVLDPAAHLLAVERAAEAAALIARFLIAHGADGRPGQGGASTATGMANRKSVLGVAHVQRSMSGATDFNRGWQDFITRVAWGEVWGDETLPQKTRSFLTLAITVALGREEEFRLHAGAALRNGTSPDEIRAVLQHAAIYAGVPAANSAFKWAAEVIAQETR